jgi:hypothetical protein
MQAVVCGAVAPALYQTQCGASEVWSWLLTGGHVVGIQPVLTGGSGGNRRDVVCVNRPPPRPLTAQADGGEGYVETGWVAWGAV